MDDFLSFIHWAFFAAALLIAVATEFIKKLWSLLPQNKWTKAFTPTRLVPAIFGLLLGLIPGIPAPEMIDTSVEKMFYFALAGILSTWLYSLAQKVFEDFLPENIKKLIESKFKKINDEEG